MSAALYNLIIERGEDFSFTLTVLDESEFPVNMAGSNFKAEIREEYKKPLVATFTPSVNSSTQEITLSLTKNQTITLDVNKKLKWDLFWIQSDESTTKKLLSGLVQVNPNITNLP